MKDQQEHCCKSNSYARFEFYVPLMFNNSFEEDRCVIDKNILNSLFWTHQLDVSQFSLYYCNTYYVPLSNYINDIKHDWKEYKTNPECRKLSGDEKTTLLLCAEKVVEKMPAYLIVTALSLMTFAIVITQGTGNAFIYFQF